MRLESFRWELSQRGIGQPPTGPDHDGRTPAGKTAARLGPAAAWLKPAFAVAAVVAVVVVGVFTLNRMQEAVIAPTGSATSPGQQHAAAAASGLASPGLWQPPFGTQTSPPVAASEKKNGTTRTARGGLHPDTHAQRLGQRVAHAERQRVAHAE